MGKLTPYRDEIVRRYQTGQSAELIAPDYDASPAAIYYVLKISGVLRTRQQAQLLRASRTPPKDGQRLLTFQVPENIWEQLYHSAAANGGTLGGEAVRFIDAGMKKEKQ